MTESQKNTFRRNLFILLCTIIYCASYFARKSFSAIKPGIAEEILDNITKGNIASALFFLYGVGQVISGILADRVKPEKLIMAGLATVTVCNIAFPFLTDYPVLLTVIWGINGFGHAFFWPPIVRLLRSYCGREHYDVATSVISAVSHGCTSLIYIIATGFIAVDLWEAMFWLGAAVPLCVLVICLFAFPYFGRHRDVSVPVSSPKAKENTAEKRKGGNFLSFLFGTGFAVLCLAVVMTGFLRDGIDEWFPTFLNDVFNMGAAAATMTGAILPVAVTLSVILTTVMYRKCFKRNPVLSAGVFFAVGALAAFVLVFIYDKNVIFVSALFLLISSATQGCITSLTCFLPAFYEKHGYVSTSAGIINGCLSIGSTVSSSLVPILFSNIGWQAIPVVFCITSLLGSLLALPFIRKYRYEDN